MNFEKLNNININNACYIKDNLPEITLSHLSQEILMMLKRIYSGNKSELTSMTQYTYQYFVLWRDSRLSNLSHIMEQIAISARIHYETLAKILVRCGIDPKNCIYIDGNPNLCEYWKASNVSYEKSLIKMFESNILLEQRIIAEYEQIIKKTDNENLKQVISKIIEDEESHILYFKRVLQELKN